MKLLEPASADITQKISRHLVPGEEELIRIASDLSSDGTFGSQWTVVTDERVLIVSPIGHDGMVDSPIRDILAARTETLVGGGCLEIVRREGPPIRVPYSASLAVEFSEVARGIEQLRKREPLLIPVELDRVRCERCGRRLPEKNGICPACMQRLATLHRITIYLKPYKGRMVLLAMASLVMTLSALLPPLITRRIVDDVLLSQEILGDRLDQRLIHLSLLVLGLVGLRALNCGAEWVHGWTVAWLGTRVTADVRSQLYQQLEMLSLRFYDKQKIGSLMSRVTKDSGTLQDFLMRGLPSLVINGLTILGILGVIFSMSWQLALSVFSPIPVMLAWGILFWGRMHRLFHKSLQSWAEFSARLSEALSGICVAKVFAQEARGIAEFEKHNTGLIWAVVRTNRNQAIFIATMSFMTGWGVVILWFFGGLKVLAGELTVGTLLAFYNYMLLLYGSSQVFGQANGWMTQAIAGAERIFEILDTPAEALEAPNARPMPQSTGQVSFRRVTFGYDPSKPVLQDIDLEVAPGEMIGLVGRSGAGKTTLMNLLCRFYDVDQGSIEVDGVDIRAIRLKDLRDLLGVVLQEPFLFSGTIAENISYGKPGASFEEVVQAAKAANAHSFILAKPDGYDMEVGERGNKLSGGERQRIAIARAILRDPKILILDEATSAVDMQTERLIQEAISRLARNRTTFIIAHRLSTVRSADRLVVLDSGRVVEVGSFNELMARQGAFYTLVRYQHEVARIMAVE